ncbi:MAG: hypothetical protein SGBAC_000301 [Bacillariaceae sp.]
MARIENKGTKKRVAVSGIQDGYIRYPGSENAPKVATNTPKSGPQNGDTPRQLEQQEHLQGWLRWAQDIHKEQTPPALILHQLPSRASTNRASHQCENGVATHEDQPSYKMPFKESAGVRKQPLFEGSDVCDTGFGTLLQRDSKYRKDGFLGGQFDDAPDDSLLVLANAAVADYPNKDCYKKSRGDGRV